MTSTLRQIPAKLQADPERMARMIELLKTDARYCDIAAALGVSTNQVEYWTKALIGSGAVPAREKCKYMRSPIGSISKPPPDKPHEAKIRKCMMCKHEFLSEHVGHRICKPCKNTNAYRTE